jgi:tRNA(adenine34) deaminase
MAEALRLAEAGMEDGEFPIGAVVVINGKIIGAAHTCEISEGRFLAHAELLALAAADRLNPFPGQRRDAHLYTTLEPCMMCLGAAMSFMVGFVTFALESPGDGACGLPDMWKRRKEDMLSYQTPAIQGGICRTESLELFKRYVELHSRGPKRDWAQRLVERASRG